MEQLSDVGLIGLGVMGENLALNMERNGRRVSVWNRTVPGVEEGVAERFVGGRAAGKQILGFSDLSEFVASLNRPRIIMMMVRAGNAVDELIDQVSPFLAEGDVLIDGGNSDYVDTGRRVAACRAHGLLFVGAGVSGGAEGALRGASIMPGGAKEAWPLIRPLLQDMAAKAADGTPCCDWVGPDGAGHFVKMVHNGIEYGDMQLIAETYFLLKRAGGMDNERMSRLFGRWNEGCLKSYLVEITSEILAYKEADGGYLVDRILDVAGQKGTGQWSVKNALELGESFGLIAEAVFQRNISTQKELRVEAARVYASRLEEEPYASFSADEVEQTLFASKLVAYAQGFDLLSRASEQFGWNLDLAMIARMWRGGCIIRSAFLDELARAYEAGGGRGNLMLFPTFSTQVREALPAWRRVVATAVCEGVAVPAFASALNYFHSLTTDFLPANLIQAQRDYFGAHTFERTDGERGKFYHEEWVSLQ